MGLLPAAEVPMRFLRLEQALSLPDSYNAVNDTAVVESSGLSEILFSDIVALHSPRIPLPESERSWRGALVLVKDEPAPYATMELVAGWSPILGKQLDGGERSASFAARTGYRAGLTMGLGAPGAVDPATPMSMGPTCEPLAQDCGEPLGCYPQLRDGVRLRALARLRRRLRLHRHGRWNAHLRPLLRSRRPRAPEGLRAGCVPQAMPASKLLVCASRQRHDPPSPARCLLG